MQASMPERASRSLNLAILAEWALRLYMRVRDGTKLLQLSQACMRDPAIFA